MTTQGIAMHARVVLPAQALDFHISAAHALNSELILAGQIEIRGEIVLARETEEYGHAEFKLQGSKSFQIPPTSLDGAMHQAYELFTDLQRDQTLSLVTGHDGALIHGVFIPSGMCVMDAFGAVIGIYNEKVWRRPAPKFTWDFITEQAKQSREDAAREAQGFNFAEAQELRLYAIYLDELVDLSINHCTGSIFREHLQ